MKLMDRTNIDFIGPRRYCMLGSAIVILLGLGLFVVRGGLQARGAMYNIDFTGGTLVTIRLDPNAPAVQAVPEARRADFVRQTAGAVLPDVSVERLDVEAERQRAVRFNIRTTEEDARKVQGAVQKQFGPSLVRLVMTSQPAAPIAAAAAPAAAATDATKSSPPPAAGDRFAGGRAYRLNFNLDQAPSRITSAFLNVLTAAGVPSPTTRFEVINPAATTAAAADAPARTLVLRTNLEPETAETAVQGLRTTLNTDPDFLFERLENFGGVVAGETRNLALMAIVMSWLIMIAYLWFRFKSVSYGFAAVLALVHDVLFTLGAVAALHYKIDLPMIAAFLTLIGFSVNDTIVIFDRIREIKGKTPILTPQMINDAVNQTLSRTILTSLTAWLVVLILFVFGGEGLAGFSFCLVVGFLSGTYSTIYIASPVLIEWSGHTRPAVKQGKGSLVTSR
jgi:SecD/SecF fusion protein